MDLPLACLFAHCVHECVCAHVCVCACVLETGRQAGIQTDKDSYTKLSLAQNSPESSAAYLSVAEKYIDAALNNTVFDPQFIGFLKGLPGLQAIAAVVYKKQGRQEDAKQMLRGIQSTFDSVNGQSRWNFDQGMSGLLYTNLFLQAHFGADAIPESSVSRVVNALYSIAPEAARGAAVRVRSAPAAMPAEADFLLRRDVPGDMDVTVPSSSQFKQAWGDSEMEESSLSCISLMSAGARQREREAEQARRRESLARALAPVGETESADTAQTPQRTPRSTRAADLRREAARARPCVHSGPRGA